MAGAQQAAVATKGLQEKTDHMGIMGGRCDPSETQVPFFVFYRHLDRVDPTTATLFVHGI